MKKALSTAVSIFTLALALIIPTNLVYGSSSSNVDRFVTRLYNICLDRNPDSDGLDYWSNQLINKEATGCSAAYGFIFSDEFQTKNCTNEEYITYMYQAFFDREPDTAGLNYWTGKLDSGLTRETIFCGFANSDEFDDICADYGIVRGVHINGKDSTQVARVNLFVERLYNLLMSRNCDNGGLEFWTNLLLNHQQSGSEVVRSFIASPEFSSKDTTNEEYVEYLYQSFMGRASDEGGKASWVEMLNNGISRDTVFNGFARSLEFYFICNSYGIDSGIKLTSWQTINGTWYYFNNDGNYVTSWQTISGNRYYFASSGVMQTSWVKISEKWYYFNDNGVMQTGWQKVSNIWYYLNSEGIMQTGWFYDGSYYYYLNESGAMQTGWKEINQKMFYFDNSGHMVTGWNNIAGIWYYFTSNGDMQLQNGWKQINNTWYYFDEDGTMHTGWLYENETYYYLNEDGSMQKEWKQIDGNWYYFSESGARITGWKKINEVYYYFNSSGVMRTGWFKDNGNYYYLNSDGSMQTGWGRIDGNYYYFTETGERVTGLKEIDGKTYYFYAYSGQDEGIMQTGLCYYNNDAYFFNSDGSMYTGGWLTSDEGTRYFSSNGVMVKNFVEIDGNMYFFNSNTGLLFTEAGTLIQSSETGILYEVQADGRLIRK